MRVSNRQSRLNKVIEKPKSIRLTHTEIYNNIKLIHTYSSRNPEFISLEIQFARKETEFLKLKTHSSEMILNNQTDFTDYHQNIFQNEDSIRDYFEHVKSARSLRQFEQENVHAWNTR